jgi:hypothetical protein
MSFLPSSQEIWPPRSNPLGGFSLWGSPAVAGAKCRFSASAGPHARSGTSQANLSRCIPLPRPLYVPRALTC